MALSTASDGNEARWDALAAYLETVAQRMGLGLYHWDIKEGESPDEDAFQLASMETSAFPSYLDFRITVYPVFWECSPARQRHQVVHELVHVINAPRQSHVHALRERRIMAHDVESLFFQSYETVDERATDWIAALLAPQMPMPPEFRPEDTTCSPPPPLEI